MPAYGNREAMVNNTPMGVYGTVCMLLVNELLSFVTDVVERCYRCVEQWRGRG